MGPLLTPFDFAIFVGSLLVVMALGLWAGRKEDTSDDYFLAGHTSRWWGVAGSIFGSNVSANHIIGMMGVGFSVGFAQSHFEISAIAGLLLLCYGFLPVYRKLNLYTLSEYLGRRYGESSRILYAAIMLLVIVVIQMVPGFYIGSRALLELLRTGESAVIQEVQIDDSGSITAITFTPGHGYAEAPEVKIDLPPSNVVADGAKATATIEQKYEIDPVTGDETDEQYGALDAIVIDNGGSGYDANRPPQVKLVGGAAYTYGSAKLSPSDINPQWYYAGILLMALVTGTYTIFGGLKAVIVTDVLQSILMLGAALLVGILTFYQIDGGWAGVMAMDAAENGGRDVMHLYLGSDHPELPWTGVLSGLMILHFYYWGTNQFIVQRALSARTDAEARTGIIVAGFFKLLIPFMSIGAGVAAYYYFRERNMLDTVDQDAAFMHLMRHIVAPLGFGIVGLVAAGVVGAILSSVDSMLNSGATIVTFDVYKRYIKPDATEKGLVWVGRLWVVVFIVAAATLTIFTMDPNSKESFFLKIASHQSKLIAGVVIAFALGMFWKRATSAGATTAILVGVAASYALPVFYSGYWVNDAKVMQGYIGATKIEQIDETEITAPGHRYLDGTMVRFYKAKKLPILAGDQANTNNDDQKSSLTDRSFFVHGVDANKISLHRRQADAASGDDPIQFLTAGQGPQSLYLASQRETVSWWGTQLNFMHSVFLAAILALLLHVIVSLATPRPSDEQSALTWTGLGGHDPSVLRNAAIKVVASVGLFALLGWLMHSETLTPLVAGAIAASWTWLMFVDAALTAIIVSQIKAIIGKYAQLKPETADEFPDTLRGTSLLGEDRFWAGLLAAVAVFMMFYFK